MKKIIPIAFLVFVGYLALSLINFARTYDPCSQPETGGDCYYARVDASFAASRSQTSGYTASPVLVSASTLVPDQISTPVLIPIATKAPCINVVYKTSSGKMYLQADSFFAEALVVALAADLYGNDTPWIKTEACDAFKLASLETSVKPRVFQVVSKPTSVGFLIKLEAYEATGESVGPFRYYVWEEGCLSRSAAWK